MRVQLLFEGSTEPEEFEVVQVEILNEAQKPLAVAPAGYACGLVISEIPALSEER